MKAFVMFLPWYQELVFTLTLHIFFGFKKKNRFFWGDNYIHYIPLPVGWWKMVEHVWCSLQQLCWPVFNERCVAGFSEMTTVGLQREVFNSQTSLYPNPALAPKEEERRNKNIWYGLSQRHYLIKYLIRVRYDDNDFDNYSLPG